MRKKVSLSLILLSILFFIYIFYKSEIVWEGSNRNYYFPYYLIFILLLGLSITIFFINLDKEKIKYLTIISISTLASLYLVEAYLLFNEKIYNNKEKIYQNELKIKSEMYQKKFGKKYDQRTKLEFYDHIRKKNKNIAMNTFPSLYLKNKSKIFPFSGISNSKTITCNENGYYAIFDSDRYGFNNPDSEWNKKNIQYLLVGDSFTLGACVNRPFDVASILRKLSNGSVLNLGYSANGPLIEYATMREYVSPNVENIIWMYYEGNDLDDLKNELQSKILLKYLNNQNFSQNLKNNQKKIDLISKKMINDSKQIYLTDKKVNFNIFNFIKLSKLRGALNHFLPKENQPKKKFFHQEELKKVLKLAKQFSLRNNSEFYFVYLPEYKRFKTNYNNSNYNLIKKITHELEIEFIDTHKLIFKKENNPLDLFPFKLSGHYTDGGL
jgi:hypothetical protein